MSNKYYTPSLEEFHVGFEFEYLSGVDSEGEDWSTRVFDQVYENYDFPILDAGEKLDSSFRVKYLDQSDIESLGWKDGETYGLSGYVLNYATDDSYQIYYDESNQFTQIYNWDAKIIFEGAIKNKSELKKLMDQLDIEC
jgi:hypothetical protein